MPERTENTHKLWTFFQHTAQALQTRTGPPSEQGARGGTAIPPATESGLEKYSQGSVKRTGGGVLVQFLRPPRGTGGAAATKPLLQPSIPSRPNCLVMQMSLCGLAQKRAQLLLAQPYPEPGVLASEESALKRHPQPRIYTGGEGTKDPCCAGPWATHIVNFFHRDVGFCG